LENWKLYSDISGGENFQLEGIGFDTIFTQSLFMGVRREYTNTYATKFYFKDFYAGHVIIDILPPSVKYVQVLSDSTLDILFSENVEQTSTKKTNYSCN